MMNKRSAVRVIRRIFHSFRKKETGDVLYIYSNRMIMRYIFHTFLNNEIEEWNKQRESLFFLLTSFSQV
jgi:hypothetical protein